jgi:hypothetical protein
MEWKHTVPFYDSPFIFPFANYDVIWYYKRKVYSVILNNSNNINKTNKQCALQIIENIETQTFADGNVAVLNWLM